MIYLDSNVIIRWVQGMTPVSAAVATRLAPLRGVPRSLLTSALSRIECRCKPIETGNATLLAEYDRFFTSAELVVAPIDDPIIEEATKLRAAFKFKTPDAIHLATAAVALATELLTGDRDLSRCTSVTVTII